MTWTTKEAFSLIREAGLTDNYYLFMKWVREGRLPASLSSKRKGYRFQEQDVRSFVAHCKKDDTYSLTAENERLRRENEDWKKKWQMPRDYWMRENAELKARLLEAEQQVASLKNELETVKNDRTIRVRVE